MAESARLRTRLVSRRLLHCGLLAVLAIGILGAGTPRIDRLGHEMICTCGCSQILMECNHVGCPVSPVMLAELRDQIAAGGTDTTVLNWFAAKYGAIVLAAPIRGGFDNVAWIMPMAVFALATFGTAGVVWVWRRRSLRLAAAAGGDGFDPEAQAPRPGSAGAAFDPETEAMRARIRQETEYR